MRLDDSSSRLSFRQIDERRVTLVGLVALYGAVISTVALYLSLTAYPAISYPFEPQRPTLLRFLFPSIVAFLSGIALAVGLTHFVADTVNEARHPLIWLLLGLVYGTLLPFITGMFLPFSFVFHDLVVGQIQAGTFWIRLANAAFYMPSSSFFWGTFGLYAGVLGGLLLGVGAWFIDLANAAGNPLIAKYGPYVISTVLSLGIIALPILAPLSLIASLGWR